jgi:molybdopterin synthase sulfur carrier subunit
MDIKIKYFGAIADAIGKNEEMFSLESGRISLFDLKKQLENIHPGIQNISYSMAVNQSIAKSDILVNANDELALLPPFAGG